MVSDSLGRVYNRASKKKTAQGYIQIRIGAKYYLAHRVAWYLHYGYWPKEVDHINGIKTDNRITNLREVMRSDNGCNKPKQSNNTSGYKGVSFHKETGKYQAKITRHGKTTNLGLHETAESAGLAYQLAARQLHGEFAHV